jgi:3-hydroxybutyryl-CoA dehydratase
MTTYLEDLREGSEYLSAARTIRNEDITAFAGLSGDFSPLHTDDEWVRKNTPFSSRIAPGALIFSISQGLRTPVIDDIAFLGFECTLVGPVYPGDTIAARWSVSQVHRSRSSPACGSPACKSPSSTRTGPSCSAAATLTSQRQARGCGTEYR